jgi:hypothetical protein
MIDERERFERAFELFEMPEPAFERLGLRRERKRLNERLAAGLVAFAILAALGGIFGRSWFSSEPVPVDEPTPTPEASMRFESPFYGYSISLPSEWSVMPASIPWAEGQPRHSDVVGANVEADGGSYSFNILIASIAIPEGMTAEAWQLHEEDVFGQIYDGLSCPAIAPAVEQIEVDGVPGRVAYAAPAGGGCDLLATFVVEGRGYVISTAGTAVPLHLPLIRSVLATIRFQSERAIAVTPSASAWRGIWPQTTREAAQEAQAQADAAGSESVWQVDWNQDGSVARRFLEQELGWQVRETGVSYVPGDAGQSWEAEVVEWYFIRCEPGATNPLYPEDPRGGDCAPTIDETRYQQVVVRTEQLIRQGRSGINLVTGWEEVRPYIQDVPPSEREIIELVERFLAARVAGSGAEAYLGPGSLPLLYATTEGVPYAEATFTRIVGPEWPFAVITVGLRLATENDEVIVRQEVWVRRDGDRLRILPAGYSLTTENGRVIDDA